MKPPVSRLPVAEIESLIVTVREHRVILAPDLATIYGVPTKALNQAVKRNADKFPTDFMFGLTLREAEGIRHSRSQIVTLKRGQNICSSYQKLRPLLEPPPAPPKPEIGFHVKEDAIPYRIKRTAARSGGRTSSLKHGKLIL